MNRAVVICALVGAMSATITLGQTPGAAEGSLPSSETVRSLLMNNWTDSVAIHYSRELHRGDLRLFGPYLAGLHNAVDWPVNQIDGATAFFGAEVLDGNGQPTGPELPPTLCESSGEVKGDAAAAETGVRQSYASIMCFDDGGVLNVEYLRETEHGLPIQIQKAYAMPPNQRFVVVRYTLTNNLAEDRKSVRARFTEVVDVNNKAALDYEESAEDLVETGIHEPKLDELLRDVHAQWHPDLNAWIVDMSASNGTFLVFGAFQEMDRHRAFQTVSDQLAFDRAVEPEMATVEPSQPPQNVEELTRWDVGLALWKEVVLEPAGKQQYAFFYAVASSLEDAQEVARQARAPMTSDFWFDATRTAYQAWLQQGRQIDTPDDPGLRKAYNRALIAGKQSQQPQFGSFVAATNPAYGFKVWPRDASVTALGFTASGHLDEAVKFYRWMASVQEDGSKQQYPAGTWYSNYSYWIRKWPKTFVEPEWDSLGLFMVGVHHTWRLLNEQDPQKARDFLTSPLEKFDQGPATVYEAVSRAAEYIKNNINEHGFGPTDHSIWEEQLEWATFTQVTYASGLNAAHLLAQQMGDIDRGNQWLAGGRRILDAIHRPASDPACPGLWNDTEQRWNRGAWPDCTRDDRLDSSTDLAWVFGLVDAADQRAGSQRDAVLSRLTPGDDDIGIARYEGDEFYFQSPFSPGGRFEASAQLPSWPQMDMYVSMLEHWRGLDDVALARLRWYASATNVGYMPPGEAVDWPTNRPLPSTAVEPVTAAWYVLGLLTYFNLFDPRLPPLGAEAGSAP